MNTVLYQVIGAAIILGATSGIGTLLGMWYGGKLHREKDAADRSFIDAQTSQVKQSTLIQLNDALVKSSETQLREIKSLGEKSDELHKDIGELMALNRSHVEEIVTLRKRLVELQDEILTLKKEITTLRETIMGLAADKQGLLLQLASPANPQNPSLGEAIRQQTTQEELQR